MTASMYYLQYMALLYQEQAEFTCCGLTRVAHLILRYKNLQVYTRMSGQEPMIPGDTGQIGLRLPLPVEYSK